MADSHDQNKFPKRSRDGVFNPYTSLPKSIPYRDLDIHEKAPVTSREDRAQYLEDLVVATKQYMKKLRQLERKCIETRVISQSIYKEVAAVNDWMLAVCARFEQGVRDKYAVKQAQADFREKTDPILSKSHVIHRTRTWPQGHQGDYKTLEIAYRNRPMSEFIGFYLDKYILSSQLGDGVRGRLAKLTALLKEELISRQKPKVLDIACGSCREITELVPEITSSGAMFKCLDLDADALDFALNRLSFTGLSTDQVEFHKYNALRLFDYDIALTDCGKQDIIYSVGYFDYLPDDFLIKMLRTLYVLLSPGGKLIASFKDAKRYRPQDFHWLADWDGFLQRDEQDFEKIFDKAGIPRSALTVSRDKSGVILFYSVTKRQADLRSGAVNEDSEIYIRS